MHRHLVIFIAGLVITAVLFLSSPALTDAQSGTSLRLLQSDSNRVVLELGISAYTIETRNVGGTVYSSLSVPELGYIGEAGKPELPIKGVMLGIPPGAEATVRILVDESRPVPLANPIIPAPTAIVESRFRDNFPQYTGNAIVADPTTYSANRLFPNDVARIASTGNWRSQRYIIVELHPFQYNPVTRELRHHRRLQVEVTFTYPRGRTAQTLGGAVKESAFEQMLQKSLLNYASAQNWRSKAPVSSRSARQPREYSGGPWLKIAVKTDGVYKVTCPELDVAGLDPASLVSSTLKIFDQNTELAINVVGNTWNTCANSDYIEFYGQALNTEYTDTNVYWLTYGGATGKRMPARNGNVAGVVPTTFTNTMHFEQNLSYLSTIPMGVEDADHWYWNYASTGYTPANRNFTFQLSQFTTSAMSPTLQYALGGWSVNNHHSRISVNGNLVDDQLWSGGRAVFSRTLAIPQSILNAGTNTLTLNVPADADPFDAIYLNYFDLSYQSSFTATNNILKFRQETLGNWQYQIAGFTGSAIEAFDITDPFSVTQIVDTTITQPGATYTLQFGEAVSTPRTYFTTSQTKTPLSITQDIALNPNLHNSTNGADYIIISPNSFIPNVQPLATWRASPSQGFRVKVVDAQEIYDAFSDGSVDAQALRDFLGYAYSNWQSPAPAFVLLVSDASYDPRGYTLPVNAMLIPPYLRMVDPWLGETVSDNRLVSFDDGSGNTLPFMAVGRLPANNTAEVDTLVSKILNYEQNPPTGNWRSTITFVTDNAYNSGGVLDPAGDFWAFSDAIASNPQYMPNGLLADRIYLNPCDPSIYPQCALPYPPYPTGTSARTALTAAINSGRLIVSYIGHASTNLWANETIYNTSEISLLANGTKLPVVLAMTCLDGYMLNPSFPSMAEIFLRSSNKGAVASWSATGEGVAHGHDYLEKGFFDAVMNDGIRRIGPATVAGKMNLWTNSGGSYHDLIDTYALFGDPASWLQIQFQNYLPFIRK